MDEYIAGAASDVQYVKQLQAKVNSLEEQLGAYEGTRWPIDPIVKRLSERIARLNMLLRIMANTDTEEGLKNLPSLTKETLKENDYGLDK